MRASDHDWAADLRAERLHDLQAERLEQIRRDYREAPVADDLVRYEAHFEQDDLDGAHEDHARAVQACDGEGIPPAVTLLWWRGTWCVVADVPRPLAARLRTGCLGIARGPRGESDIERARRMA